MSKFDETFKSNADELRRYIAETVKYHPNNIVKELENVLILAFLYGRVDALQAQKDRLDGGR
jgi:hypothetical protein